MRRPSPAGPEIRAGWPGWRKTRAARRSAALQRFSERAPAFLLAVSQLAAQRWPVARDWERLVPVGRVAAQSRPAELAEAIRLPGKARMPALGRPERAVRRRRAQRYR